MAPTYTITGRCSSKKSSLRFFSSSILHIIDRIVERQGFLLLSPPFESLFFLSSFSYTLIIDERGRSVSCLFLPSRCSGVCTPQPPWQQSTTTTMKKSIIHFASVFEFACLSLSLYSSRPSFRPSQAPSLFLRAYHDSSPSYFNGLHGFDRICVVLPRAFGTPPVLFSFFFFSLFSPSLVLLSFLLSNCLFEPRWRRRKAARSPSSLLLSVSSSC